MSSPVPRRLQMQSIRDTFAAVDGVTEALKDGLDNVTAWQVKNGKEVAEGVVSAAGRCVGAAAWRGAWRLPVALARTRANPPTQQHTRAHPHRTAPYRNL